MQAGDEQAVCQACAEDAEHGQPQPVHRAHAGQQRPGQRQEADQYGDVLVQRGLYRVEATGAGAIEQRQQGEQKARQHCPQQSDCGVTVQAELGRDQDQPHAYHADHGELAGAGALAKQQALQQYGEGREAGEAEGGDGHAGNLHRFEEGDPVRAQQQAAECQQSHLP